MLAVDQFTAHPRREIYRTHISSFRNMQREGAVAAALDNLARGKQERIAWRESTLLSVMTALAWQMSDLDVFRRLEVCHRLGLHALQASSGRILILSLLRFDYTTFFILIVSRKNGQSCSPRRVRPDWSATQLVAEICTCLAIKRGGNKLSCR